MSPLLRDVKGEINNQGRSQTSEQDEASFEHRRPKVRIPWNFFFRKVNLGPISRRGNCNCNWEVREGGMVEGRVTGDWRKKERKKERSLLPLSMKAKPNKSNISSKKGDKLLYCFKILRYFLPCPPLIMLRAKECSLWMRSVLSSLAFKWRKLDEWVVDYSLFWPRKKWKSRAISLSLISTRIPVENKCFRRPVFLWSF